MPSLLACLGCGGRGESDDITTLDYTHASLTDVPADVFACERTLEELYLDSNQLRELPRQLFYCHGLRVLGLSDNELTALPPAVASLINLTNIDLSKNAISDIPDNIKGCRHLAVVDASINPLCRLPEGFTQLPTLTELYLNDTFLEYLPASFGRLSRLRILELRENQLNTLPKTIMRLTNLQRLDIGQNDFSELPEVIGSLGNLTELWFDNNKVKSLPPLLGRLRKLEHVDASKNKVDWVAAEIESCTALTDLHLSSNHLKELPEKLGGCRQLQVLKLDDNALTHLPESIGGLAALQELVVTQNDLETLPASMGLLRNLHTVHLDDNLLTELPPELGSCSNLTVLTAASNRLTSVPAELGHLPHLAVLNLCDNLIPYLPVSLTKLKLRALWLSENQNKPQVQLQSETLPETGQRVLTCFMLPQQPRNHQPETVVEADTFPGQGWDEQRRAKTLIKFAFDGDVDKPGRLTRAPTPYPKELKALAKHARNLHSLQKDPTGATGRQFVMPKTKDSTNKTATPASPSSASVTQPGKGEVSETDLTRKPTPMDPLVSSHILDNGRKREDRHMEEDDEGEDGEGPAPPLAVMKLPAEERPLLREARNVRNSHLTPSTSSSTTGAPEGGERMVNGTGRKAGTAPADQPYAIGDRKVFGLAQVVTTSPPTQNKAPTSESGKGEETTPHPPLPPTTAPPPMSTPIQEAPAPACDGEASSDPQDKRIKKPPPYHIAAVMSRHASDFGGEGVMAEGAAPVALVGRPGQGTATSPTSPTSPLSPAAAAAGGVVGEDETNDTTSSSSDSGYGNGKASTQPSDDQVCSERSSLHTPSSPHNLTDSAYSMPSTPSSPPGTLSLASPQSSSRSFMASLSTAPHRPSSLSVPPSVTSLPSHTSPSSPYSPSTTVSYSSPYSPANNTSQRLFPTQHPPHSHAVKPSARPASIATGTQLEPSNGAPVQRPGSLALGALADSALLNRLPHDHRPGSLAAPINTLGIPPPPARAVSHMGLNMASPPRPIDHSMFRSQDLTRPSNGGWDHRGSNHRQESNGLVSIIDQVTSSLLEHGDSPPPKTLPSDMTSPSSPLQASSTASMGYSQPGMVMGGGKDHQPPPITVPASSNASHSYQTTTNNFAANNRSAGPTNFTQDQPRGEVLHPTPHRPSLMSPSNSLPSNDILQESSMDDLESGHSGNELNDSFSEASITPQKSTSKLPSRIPAPRGSSEAAYGGLKGPHRDPLSPSQSTIPHTDSRIPTTPSAAAGHSNTTRSPNSLTGEPLSQSHTPSRLQAPGSISRSPGVTQELKLTPDSKIPSLNSNTHPLDRPGPESRIPTLGNIGRSPSGLSKDFQSPPQEAHKLMDYRSPNEQGESRIPTMGTSGHTPTEPYSKVARPSPGDTPRGYTSSHSRVLTTGQQAGGGGASGIPTLASQGRSNSGLGTNHSGPGGSTGKTHPSTPSYGFSKMPSTPTSTGGEGSQMHQSRLQCPSYSSGIRPPSIHPTQSPPSQQPQPQPQPQSQPQTPRGYSSGIRPPAINSAINTPGIPIPSPLATPGSRGSVTSTGSASRIPHAAGLSSKIPAPGSSKHRVSPSSASPTGQQSPLDTTKANHQHHSAWMFGQHKNARVVCHNFPVMIEKNPDLGFTIGQSSADPDDKSIYVVSVAGGGAASSALKVGDKLLQVDGVDLRQADLHKATAILHNTHSTVSLMVSRLQ